MYKVNLNNEIAEYLIKHPDKKEFIIGENIIHKGALGKGKIKDIYTIKENFYISIEFKDSIKVFVLSSLGEWFEELALNEGIEEGIKSQVETKKELERLKDIKRKRVERLRKLEEIAIEKCKKIDILSALFEEEFQRYEKKKLIMDVCYQKNITSMYHFTKLENLESILENGILSIEDLNRRKINFKGSDKNRYDNLENYICTSIQFPNYKMFFKVRCEIHDSQWVVIELNPKILWKKECLFFYTNAANSRFKEYTVSEYNTSEHLKKIFFNLSYAPSRDKLRIPDSYPTDPQAEVLVKNEIETQYIKAIYYNRYTDSISKIIKKYGNRFIIRQSEYLFGNRQDFEFWKVKERC